MLRLGFVLSLAAAVLSTLVPSESDMSSTNSHSPPFSLGKLQKGDELAFNIRMIHPKLQKDDTLFLKIKDRSTELGNKKSFELPLILLESEDEIISAEWTAPS